MSERTCDLMINSSSTILLSHSRTPGWQRPQVTMDVLECPIAAWPRNVLLLDFSRPSGETHPRAFQESGTFGFLSFFDLYPQGAWFPCTPWEAGSCRGCRAGSGHTGSLDVPGQVTLSSKLWEVSLWFLICVCSKETITAPLHRVK